MSRSTTRPSALAGDLVRRYERVVARVPPSQGSGAGRRIDRTRGGLNHVRRLSAAALPWRRSPNGRAAGTAGGGINYGIVGSNTVWYVQVGALVIGHIAALTLAHDRALAVYDNVRHASRSQYFMLAVMVGFTCFGLYLLSAGNG